MAHREGRSDRMDEKRRKQVTSYAKEKRPGGYPRRKPHRKYGYSDDTRKHEGAIVVMCLMPLAIVVLMGVGM